MSRFTSTPSLLNTAWRLFSLPPVKHNFYPEPEAMQNWKFWPGNVQILPAPDYVNIINMIEKNCALLNLQPTEIFVKKTLELYEMIIVRHGLMLVGFSFGAKTCAYKILAASLTNLKEAGLNDENVSKYAHINSQRWWLTVVSKTARAQSLKICCPWNRSCYMWRRIYIIEDFSHEFPKASVKFSIRWTDEARELRVACKQLWSRRIELSRFLVDFVQIYNSINSQ